MNQRRSAVIAVVSSLGMLFALETTAIAACDPGDWEVCLFTEANYRGEARITLPDLGGGVHQMVYYETMSANHPIPNDWLSSFKVGAHAKLTVCTDWYFGAYCYVYEPNTDMPFLPSRGAPWYCDPNWFLCNDWASSLIVEPVY